MDRGIMQENYLSHRNVFASLEIILGVSDAKEDKN